jgi:hypothetical protein
MRRESEKPMLMTRAERDAALKRTELEVAEDRKKDLEQITADHELLMTKNASEKEAARLQHENRLKEMTEEIEDLTRQMGEMHDTLTCVPVRAVPTARMAKKLFES